MITLRSLKKKSKQAMVYINKYKLDERKQFLAIRGDNYHGLNIRCTHLPNRRTAIKCDCQYHPLKGTPMLGATQGYYEPEWYETTAFSALCEIVSWNEKPKDVTEYDWLHMQRITGCKPMTIKEIEDMYKEV